MLFLAHCITDSFSFNLIPNMPVFVQFNHIFHYFYDARGDEKPAFFFEWPKLQDLKWHNHQAYPTHNSSIVLVYYVVKCEW